MSTYDVRANTRGAFNSLTIDVAETTGFALLRVMKTSSPVDSDITLLAIQSRSSLHAASSADTTELEQAIEDRAVIPHVEAALLFLIHLHVVRRHLLEEVDVLVGVKLGHLEARGWFGALLRVSNMLSLFYGILAVASDLPRAGRQVV